MLLFISWVQLFFFLIRICTHVYLLGWAELFLFFFFLIPVSTEKVGSCKQIHRTWKHFVVAILLNSLNIFWVMGTNHNDLSLTSIINDLSGNNSFRSSFNFTEGKGLETIWFRRRICHLVTISSQTLSMNIDMLNYPFVVPGVLCTVGQCTLVRFGMCW